MFSKKIISCSTHLEPSHNKAEDLRSGIEDLLRMIREESTRQNKELLPESIDAIRDIAYRVMEAHKGQKRTEGLPYFVHQLDVTRSTVRTFSLIDQAIIHIALLHDTREDQAESYEDIKRRLEEKIATLPEQSPARIMVEENLPLIRLGVRMLSNSGYDMETYIDQLLHPQKHYDKYTPGSTYYADYNDPRTKAVITGVLKIKMADILCNCASLAGIFANGPVTERQSSKPQRTFDKLLDYYLPLFVERLPQEFAETKRVFYSKLRDILKQYALNEETSAAPLRGAAIGALERLQPYAP